VVCLAGPLLCSDDSFVACTAARIKINERRTIDLVCGARGVPCITVLRMIALSLVLVSIKINVSSVTIDLARVRAVRLVHYRAQMIALSLAYSRLDKDQ
jgi:hypothetical protein